MSVKVVMKQLLVLFICVFALHAEAQTVEVNPNIQWRYVRTQEITLQSGRLYQFEFPAEKGYDYVVNLTHGLPDAFSSLSVTDIQYGPVRNRIDSTNSETMDLNFRVSDNGTYVLTVVLSNHELDAKLASVISIVRRPIVEY